MKNELILATRKGSPQKRAALRLQEILDRLGLDGLRERFYVPAQFIQTNHQINQGEVTP